MTRELTKSLAKAAKALGKVGSWPPKVPASNSATDYLFEVYVLSCLLADLRGAGWSTSLIPGSGSRANTLPRKPAKKSSGWASFLAKSPGGIEYEICCGTQILDINQDERAPDISLQTPPGVQIPTHAQVALIIDAKYKAKSSTKISSHEFSEFARWLELLGCKGKQIRSVVGVLDKNSLVTNAKPSTEKPAERARTGVNEVHDFWPTRIPLRLP